MTTSDTIAYLIVNCSVRIQNFIYVVLSLRTPRAKPSSGIMKSFSNYHNEQFVEDLTFILIPFHVISIFEEIDNQVDTFNALFSVIVNKHALAKRINMKSRTNSLVTQEIRHLMKTIITSMTVYNRTHRDFFRQY